MAELKFQKFQIARHDFVNFVTGIYKTFTCFINFKFKNTESQS